MEENTMRPGLPNYVGPKKGYFGLLHHDCLYEWSHDVTERVDYVRRAKPPHEIPTRLHNMIYLGGCAAVKGRDASRDEYYKKVGELIGVKQWNEWAEILAYIRKHIPDCAWDEALGELTFPAPE